jgi:hypothetical protein
MAYLDFDLLIQRAGAGYRAQVVNSPAGQAVSPFSMPFSDLELENFLLRIGRPRQDVRRIDSPEVAAAKSFGERLFATVFEGEVRGCLRSSLDEASRQDAGLRIRLRLTEVPELGDLAWEYLYNSALNRFLALSIETPLVRYLDLSERIRPLAVTPPLRVLVMIASPGDYLRLDVEREWGKLHEALGDLEQHNLVALERLDEATLAALQRRLRRGEYHIVHFIGHGGFNQQTQDGVLILEDGRQRGRAVSGQDLGVLLHDHRPMRLAILNACEGARTSLTDPFAGTAQSLLQQGVPAVIAMQFEITDEAAITFAHEFYAALADGYPVDAALAEARKAIFAQGNGLEWGTPVLYTRAPDGRIFDVKQVSEVERRNVQIAALYREAQRSMIAEDWTPAIEGLQALLALHPPHAEAQASLTEARQQRELAALYAAGRTHYEARRWQEALDCFYRVLDIKNSYKDVNALIATLQSEIERTRSVSPSPELSTEPPTDLQRIRPSKRMKLLWISCIVGALALVVYIGAERWGIPGGQVVSPPKRTEPARSTPLLAETPVSLTTGAITWKSLAELRGHTAWVWSAAFSPDSKWIVTASRDNTARVWEASTGKSIAELRGHTYHVWSAAFSLDGKWIVTASADQTARVWELSME